MISNGICGYTSAISRRVSRPSFAISSPSIERGRREGRTSTEARGPPAQKNAGGRYHRSSRTIRPSLRDGFNGCFAFSPVHRLLATVRAMRFKRMTRDTSIGVSGPRDLTVRAELFVDAKTRCNPTRPSHSAADVHDDRDTSPPTQRNERDHNADLANSTSDLSLSEGLDRIQGDELILVDGQHWSQPAADGEDAFGGLAQRHLPISPTPCTPRPLRPTSHETPRTTTRTQPSPALHAQRHRTPGRPAAQPRPDRQ